MSIIIPYPQRAMIVMMTRLTPERTPRVRFGFPVAFIPEIHLSCPGSLSKALLCSQR